MPYSGAGKYTNWMTITYNGVSNPGALSENIPVTVDGVTTYGLYCEATPDNANWASGYTLTLTFYNASNVQVSAVTASSGSLTTGVHNTTNTTPGLAPATSSYCTAQITYNGAPAATNPLDVFLLRVQTAANTNIPDTLNYNYAFVNGTYPWTNLNSSFLSQVAVKLAGADGNPDSLVIGGLIELMGGPDGVQCTVPDLTDPVSGQSARFRISTPGGQLQTLTGGSGPYDLGAPQPTQDFVESLLLDGERPFGRRSSNRTIQIPVVIKAPTQQTLNAARDFLLSTIDQQTYELAWTPAATGLTTVYDCFRALPSTIMYGFNNLREGSGANAPAIGLVTINLQALPYGRSGTDGVVEVDFSSNLVNGAPAASAVTIDSFGGTIDSADGWKLNTQWTQSNAQSVRHAMPVPMHMPWPAAVYSHTLASSANIVGCPVLSIWFGQSYDSQWPRQPKFKSDVTISAVLTDSNGKTLSCKRTIKAAPWNADPNKPAWKQISLPIPQKVTGFSYNAVASYKLTITNWAGAGTAGYVRMHAWLGGITAQPLSIQSSTSPRAVVYNMFGLSGSGPAAVSTQVQLPNNAQLTQEYTKSGNWKVPAGVSSVQAECWGGGGGGASVNTAIGGGGGGGGEYAAEPSLVVTPGQNVPFTVGTGGFGGQLVNSFTTWTAPGSFTWTCPANVTSAFVECWGAGAAGTAGGGGGGGGEYSSQTFTVTPGTIYTLWVGKGGEPNTGRTAQANASRNGQGSWFGNPGNQYLSTALIAAHGGNSPLVGSSDGGLGGAASAATAHWWGGKGGRSPGPAGGGGGAGAASTGPGSPGGNSPKSGTLAGGNYTTGGIGGVGPGGNGGNGANVPGAATRGSNPGGGGGGGYTKGVNYQGARGGDGQVQVTWAINGGSPVNGTSTVFGSAGTTGTVVTAHGGSTPATNAGTGAAGGSGSTNSSHFSGGKGGLSENNGNYLTSAGLGLGSLGTATPSTTATATVTSGAGTVSTGMVYAIVATSAALSNELVTDSAGNQYYAYSKQALPDGSWLQIYASHVRFSIPNAAVLTIANSSSMAKWVIQWGYNLLALDIDDSASATSSGTSTTPSVTFTNADISTAVYEILVCANDNTQTATNFANGTGFALFSHLANGTLCLDFAGRQVGGSAVSLNAAGSLSSSSPWATAAIPFINSNLQTQNIYSGLISYTGTTGGLTLNSQYPPMDANSGYLMVQVHCPAASTIGVSDSVGNSYSAITNVAVGTAHIYWFGAPITHALASGATITVTSSVNQATVANLRYIKNATGIDGTPVTATGTSNSISITTPAGTNSGDLQYVTGAYVNASSLLSSSSFSGGASPLRTDISGGTVFSNNFSVMQPGTTTTTLTEGLSSSVTWGAAAFNFTLPVTSQGGGSSAGNGGAGADGTSRGAPAYTGGGKGADGLTGSAQGNPGSRPGGGASGAVSASASAQQGGTGAPGLVRVTYTPPLIPFNDFLLHRPGYEATPDLNPLISIPPGDPPDNREYSVPSLVSGRTARFNSTYSVILCAASWNNAGVSRRLSVTVNQYEYPGGPAVSTQATRTLTPDTDIVNGYVSMGNVTLPIKGYSDSNTDSFYTVSIHDTNPNDSFQDLMFLDTQGQTVIVNIAPGSAGDGQYVNFYVDEPSTEYDIGDVLGTSHERDRAISVLDMAVVTGGPLFISPGDNLLLAYSTKGAPNLQVTYSPRWYTDRLV